MKIYSEPLHLLKVELDAIQRLNLKRDFFHLFIAVVVVDRRATLRHNLCDHTSVFPPKLIAPIAALIVLSVSLWLVIALKATPGRGQRRRFCDRGVTRNLLRFDDPRESPAGDR